MTESAESGELGCQRYWPWLLLYAVMTLVLLLPLSLEPHRRLPDDGDAVQNLWIIWWGATHLSSGYPDIYDANAYHPHGQGLVYSEPQLSQAILSWPLFRFLDNRVLAYNLLMIFSLILTAFAMHLFLREIVGSMAAASVGAVLFTFSSYSFSQLPRSQLVSLQWLPLALWCLHRFFSRSTSNTHVGAVWGRDRAPALLGFILFSVLLGLACFYYLQFYLIALAILVPGYILAYRTWTRPRELAWLSGAFFVIGVPLFLAVWPYLKLFAHYGFTGEASSYDLAHFFRPPPGSLLDQLLGLAEPSIVRVEDQFLGFAALALGLFGVYAFVRSGGRRETRTVGFAYAFLGVMSFFLAAGPEVAMNGQRWFSGPFQLIQLIKPLANLRDPYRFSILVRLALALFAAIGVRRLVTGHPRRRHFVIVALSMLLLVGEQWTPRHTSGSEIPVGADVPEAYRALAEDTDQGPVAELPPRPFRRIRWDTIDSYFSTFHARSILVGKPSFTPPAFELIRWELSDFPSDSSVALLRALGIQRVLIHPKRWGSEREQRMQMLARRRDELPLLQEFSDRDEDDELWARWELGSERLHAVTPAVRTGTARICDCREIDRSLLRVEANGATAPELAVDGDTQTKWITGDYQEEGFFFEIAFDRPRVPTRIEIEMAFPYEEFARNLEINGFQGERFYRLEQIEDPWYTIELVRQLVDDPKHARLRYDFEPMEVDRIRLFIHRTEPGVHGWAIPEIHVFEAVTSNQ